jgi:D-alanyl-lipoteichoic acid acyltransferase DltB (MBOAT superfamily)
MDTASFQFVLFGLAVALVSNFSRSRLWRSAVLMAASIIFLVLLAHSLILVFPLICFLLLGYVGLLLIRRCGARSIGWTILALLSVYVWLKKYSFLPEGIILHSPYFTIGLSYILFRVLHLLIDSGDDKSKTGINFGAYLLYTLNFTTLVSGPIQRYEEFARDQFSLDPLPLGPQVIGAQLERIVRGLFKVNVLALLLHAAQDDALARSIPSFHLSLRLFSIFNIFIIYPLFLYSNFSGYIDIVIALARLMRVRLPENFNRPFSASSFLDFWNRWHITLSTWLKTYVYNPLLIALMRWNSSPALEPLLGVLCFFVTFFLVGVWHGRTSEFIFFGVLQGGGVAVNKLWQLGLARGLGRKQYKTLAANPVYIALGRGLTFSWFAFTLLWFWSSWIQIGKLLHIISITQLLVVWLFIWFCAAVVLSLWEFLRSALLSIKVDGNPVLTHRYARMIYASVLGLAVFVFVFLLNQPAPDIVYKTF